MKDRPAQVYLPSLLVNCFDLLTLHLAKNSSLGSYNIAPLNKCWFNLLGFLTLLWSSFHPRPSCEKRENLGFVYCLLFQVFIGNCNITFPHKSITVLPLSQAGNGEKNLGFRKIVLMPYCCFSISCLMLKKIFLSSINIATKYYLH